MVLGYHNACVCCWYAFVYCIQRARKRKLATIAGAGVFAVYNLEFSPKTGTYIPHSSVKDVECYVCPYCSNVLPNSIFENQIDKNYASVKFDDLHRPLQVDLRDLPFDTDYAEAVHKLTGNENPKKKQTPRKRTKKQMLKCAFAINSALLATNDDG